MRTWIHGSASVNASRSPLSPASNRIGEAASRSGRFLQRLFAIRLAWIGALALAVTVLLAFGADLIAGDPTFQDYESVLTGPSIQHIFGTDELGRDVYARVIYGSRVSLQVAVVAAGIGAAAGVAIGIVSGYYGRWADELLMRLMDGLHAFPALVLALAITAALGPSAVNAMVAIGVVNVPVFARLVRGQTLSARERDYVLAALASGARPLRIMTRHIGPNVVAPVIVQASLASAFAILAEAALSFLGLGVRPPTPSWGSMLRTGYQFLSQAPWLSIFPGVAIFLTVLGFNLLGDGLRQALDPRITNFRKVGEQR